MVAVLQHALDQASVCKDKMSPPLLENMMRLAAMMLAAVTGDQKVIANLPQMADLRGAVLQFGMRVATCALLCIRAAWQRRRNLSGVYPCRRDGGRARQCGGNRRGGWWYLRPSLSTQC